MTVLCVLSLKGSPGVTTLSCLLAATWPTDGPVTVVEADRAGGDLAARFGLSSTVGWSSLAAAARRGGEDSPLEPHLQRLPGGLAVLVSAGGEHLPRPDSPDVAIVRGASGLMVVDLGRVVPTSPGPTEWERSWLRACDGALVVVDGEPTGALHVRTHAAALLDCTAGRLGLVVVGAGSPSGDDVGSFAGVRSFGDVPRDPAAAAVASGASGSGRRLERSRLLASARRIADALAELTEADGADGWTDPDRRARSVQADDPGVHQGSGRSVEDRHPSGELLVPVATIGAGGAVGSVDAGGPGRPQVVAR